MPTHGCQRERLVLSGCVHQSGLAWPAARCRSIWILSAWTMATTAMRRSRTSTPTSMATLYCQFIWGTQGYCLKLAPGLGVQHAAIERHYPELGTTQRSVQRQVRRAPTRRQISSTVAGCTNLGVRVSAQSTAATHLHRSTAHAREEREIDAVLSSTSATPEFRRNVNPSHEFSLTTGLPK